VRKAVDDALEEGLQVVTAAIMGAKRTCASCARRGLWDLRKFQSKIQAAGFKVAESYVSVTEVSEYRRVRPRRSPGPALSGVAPADMRAFCFYPMSKRRGEGHNWYSLPYDERLALMRQHGSSGSRVHKGRVLQVVTGSTGTRRLGVGVTLFGVHVDDLKDCVYTMRFDEASTLYAEFGAFTPVSGRQRGRRARRHSGLIDVVASIT